MKKAQALSELSILGSIILMLLGVLLHYGLKYNYMQQVQQKAFRRALAAATGNFGATYYMLRDKYVPSPEHPFGAGSTIPTASQSSVLRDFEAYKTADDAAALPQMIFDANGTEYTFYSAAFHGINGINESDLPGYRELYGETIVVVDDEAGCNRYSDIQVNPETGEENGPAMCLDPIYDIKVLDSLVGNFFDPVAAEQRCSKLPDIQSRYPGVQAPPYCGGGGASDLKMGLQPDYEQDIETSANLGVSGQSSQESLGWSTTTKRTFIYNDSVGADGMDNKGGGVTEKEIITRTSVTGDGEEYTVSYE